MSTKGSKPAGGIGERMLSFFWPKPAETVAERARRRISLHLIPFLFFLYILSFLDRVNVSVAQLGMNEPPLAASVATAVGLGAAAHGAGPLLGMSGLLAGRADPIGTGGLGFDPSIIGLGFGIFFLGYWILEVPSTVFVVKWGARWVFARILVLWGLCATLFGAMGTPLAAALLGWLPHGDNPEYQFYALRFLLGFFEGGFFPSVIVYLSYWFRAEDRGKAIACFMIAIPVSSVVGNPLSGVLLGVHWFGLAGWRWIFIVEGVAPVLAGFATLFLLPDRPAKARWLPADEREWLRTELEQEHRLKQTQGHGALLHHVGMVGLLTAVYFCLNVSGYGLTSSLPPIIKSLSDVSDQRASFLAALPYGVALIAMLVNGWHSDRTGERFWHAALPLALLSVGLGLTAWLIRVPVWPVVILIVVVGAGMYAYLPAFWPIPTMFLGATLAAVAIGLINMIGNLGGFLGPYIVGSLASGNADKTRYASSLSFLVLFPLISAVTVLIVGYSRHRLLSKQPTLPEPDAVPLPPIPSP